LSSTQFLYLNTIGWKSGIKHEIEIWFVEFNKKYYIISERGEHAHWVQNIKHNPTIKFKVSAKMSEATARIVDPLKESELVDRISKLMDSKYKWSQGLIVEIIP
jgi:deazaflavin-dependent oxidoreductase (nitroreductase family)